MSKIVEKALVDRYKKLYRSIDNLRSESTIRDKQRQMKEIRNNLRKDFDYTTRDIDEIVKTQKEL